MEDNLIVYKLKMEEQQSQEDRHLEGKEINRWFFNDRRGKSLN
jgi:hypothetical protein